MRTDWNEEPDGSGQDAATAPATTSQRTPGTEAGASEGKEPFRVRSCNVLTDCEMPLHACGGASSQLQVLIVIWSISLLKFSEGQKATLVKSALIT